MKERDLANDVAFLRRNVDLDIAREGEMASFMIRIGLLRDILTVASDALTAAKAPDHDQ